MNKAQLVDALTERFGGDKKQATTAVDGFIDTIVRAVSKGEKVQITGFGVFEKRDRAARMARNPATGEKVRVKKTSVPAFRAGAGFKDVVSGAKKLPKATAAKKTTAKETAAKATRKATAAAPTAKAAPTTKATKAGKATKAAKAPSKTSKAAGAKAPAKAPAKKTTAKKAATKAPAGKKAATKAPAKKTTARKTTR